MGKMGTTVALAGAAVGAVAGVTAIACAKRAAACVRVRPRVHRSQQRATTRG